MANTSIVSAFERMWEHIVIALSGKSDVSHTHNDIYYTEDEIDTMLDAIDWFSKGISIPSGADLDTYTTHGKYYTQSGSVAKSLLNCPTGADNFAMYVFTRVTGASITQMIITLGSKMYIRGSNSSGSFGAWKVMNNPEIKIGDKTFLIDEKADTINLVAGDNVTITADTDTNTITISATDTTYTAGTGLLLDGNEFKNTGILEVKEGSANGTISVNANGITTDVAVTGLKSAAYTESSAYDTTGAADQALVDAKAYTDEKTANTIIASGRTVNISGTMQQVQISLSEARSIQGFVYQRSGLTYDETTGINGSTVYSGTLYQAHYSPGSYTSGAYVFVRNDNQHQYYVYSATSSSMLIEQIFAPTVVHQSLQYQDGTIYKLNWSDLNNIPDASTSVKGIVQLSSSVSSTDTTMAATPLAVKQAYGLANQALPKAGGAMTGALTLSSDPTENLHAATKQYVDGKAVQPDYNQSDITAADYIKNRPFYGEETALFENITDTFEAGSVSGVYVSNGEAEVGQDGALICDIPITTGKKYKVCVDKEELVGIVVSYGTINGNTYRGFGNLSFLDSSKENTGESLLCVFDSTCGSLFIYTKQSGSSHVVSLYDFSTVVRIDEKYLPSTVATKTFVNAKTSLILYGTEDLIAGTSELATGKIYVVYE